MSHISGQDVLDAYKRLDIPFPSCFEEFTKTYTTTVACLPGLEQYANDGHSVRVFLKGQENPTWVLNYRASASTPIFVSVMKANQEILGAFCGAQYLLLKPFVSEKGKIYMPRSFKVACWSRAAVRTAVRMLPFMDDIPQDEKHTLLRRKAAPLAGIFFYANDPHMRVSVKDDSRFDSEPSADVSDVLNAIVNLDSGHSANVSPYLLEKLARYKAEALGDSVA